MSDDLVKRLRSQIHLRIVGGLFSEAADRVEELEAKNRELVIEIISANGQAIDACDAQKAAEEKLAKVMTHIMEYSNDPHLVSWAEVALAEIEEVKHG